MSSFYSREELEQIGFRSLGEDVNISRNVILYGAEHMSFGNHVRVDDHCILSGKIEVGNYVHVAVCCLIFAGKTGVFLEDFSGISARGAVYAESDDYSGAVLTNPMVPMKYRRVLKGPVRVGKHCVIGTGSTLLPGVVVGEGSSVGAMSLISKSLDPWGIYVGIPCRRIGDRKQDLLLLEKQLLEEENG